MTEIKQNKDQGVKQLATTIIAHRGASKFAPENTLAAFEMAYEMGADGIETDVHLTKDLVPVLIHDERVNRTTNGNGYIKDLMYEQLCELDAGSWFAPQFAGERIITLDRFLQWAKDKPIHLNIELKNNKIDYPDLETIVYERLQCFEMLDRTVLSTFSTKSIKRMNCFGDTVEVALLTSKKDSQLMEKAEELGVNALHIHYRLLDLALIEACYAKNIALRVYTINRASQMLRCFKYNCTSIITDTPAKAVKYRKFNWRSFFKKEHSDDKII